MDAQEEPIQEAIAPAGGGRWSGRSLAHWAPMTLVWGGILGWGASRVQISFGFAPLLLFPLLAGVVLGITLGALVRLLQMGNRPTIWTGLVLAALAAVVSQHYFDYRAARDRADEEIRQFKLARRAFPEEVRGHPMLPPDGFTDFLTSQAARGRPMGLGGLVARGWMAWLTWALDGLLVLAAAAVPIAVVLRQPYCERCQSWFRTTRGGRIAPETARELARAASLALPEDARAPRYRLVTCQGGCGPTGFELSWSGTGSTRAWLDHAARNRIVEILDKK